MINLDLSTIRNLSKSLSYHVSPLFEMAVSLHTLAQAPSHPKHLEWTERTLQKFQEEDLLAEWEYLSPIFARSVPAFFAPHFSYRANGIEEQYDFLVDLSNEIFVQSLQHVFAVRSGETDPSPFQVELDLSDKPKVVKARFTLFLCTYMQLIFEAKWEQVAPKLVRDIEAKSLALQTQEDLAALLREWFPTSVYDSKTNVISIHSSDCASFVSASQPSISTFVLSPSWFIGKSYMEVIDNCLHVTYGIASQPK